MGRLAEGISNLCSEVWAGNAFCGHLKAKANELTEGHSPLELDVQTVSMVHSKSSVAN